MRVFLLADHEAVRREDERPSVLSERERSVLDLIGEGLTDRQIASRLHVSEKTVKNHVSQLRGKLRGGTADAGGRSSRRKYGRTGSRDGDASPAYRGRR
ncbi:hypothetical protein CIB93_32615 [Streptomyces sp. WZ.A104]|nr:hypothetical protein CIB93_32615 [Streptomyces sp. WZ.A104]